MTVSSQQPLLAGRYRVVRRIGSGGMATVFLAEDERLGRRVAVKRLHADSPEDLALRFEREAKVGASLNHPNLVGVFDTVTDPEGVLIVMEYVEGENLARAISSGDLDPERALEILRGVADALDHAHRGGVIHRDVKPANVLIGKDGRARLADLGIAYATERTHITRSGTVLGTPSYMAPEQLEGGDLGPATDVYALAAVAFEALSGRKARVGRTPLEIAHRVATEGPPDLRDAWPEAPEGLADALKQGMARAPADRPRSAGELVRLLAAGLPAAAAGLEPSTAFEHAEHPEPREPVEEPLPAEPRVPVEEPEPREPAEHPEPREPAEEPEPAEPVEAREPTPSAAAAQPVPREPDEVSPEPARPAARIPTPVPFRERRAAPPWLGRAAAILIVLLLAGGVVAMVLAGGGEDQTAGNQDRAERPQPAEKSEEPAPATGGSAAGGPPGSPEQTVVDFYTRAAEDDFDGAWSMLTPAAQSQLGGSLRDFERQQSVVESVEFTETGVESQSGDEATVSFADVSTHATKVDRCTGTVDLVNQGGTWMIDRFHIAGCTPSPR